MQKRRTPGRRRRSMASKRCGTARCAWFAITVASTAAKRRNTTTTSRAARPSIPYRRVSRANAVRGLKHIAASSAYAGEADRNEPPMISQFFEINVNDGHVDTYMELAASLKPKLDAMGGCLFIDRYRSLTRENLLLSYQIWRDEGSMTAWRVNAGHHHIQEAGGEKVFTDSRIRIAQVIPEARPGKPIWQPERRTPYNDPARRAP